MGGQPGEDVGIRHRNKAVASLMLFALLLISPVQQWMQSDAWFTPESGIANEDQDQ